MQLTKALLVLLAFTGTALGNELENGDFEQGLEGWRVFNPDETPAVTIDVGTDPDQPDNNVLRMTSGEVLRFSAGSSRVPVQPGETWDLRLRYRLADSGIMTAPNTPGFLVRITASDQGGAGAESAHQHVDTEGKVYPVGVPLGHLQALEPDTQWQQLEASFIVPEGVHFIHLDLFFWRMQGELWIDDVVLKKKG